jgi:predicted dehydrogenase
LQMRIAIIGCSGHYGMCIPKEYCKERDFVAIAPGSQGENMDGVEQRLLGLGYAPERYSDYRELLEKEKPDIAVVDNYYGEHGPVILDCFQAGCHVFAEKPAATSLEELERLVAAWKQAGTCFMAMYNYRYMGAFHRAWQLILQLLKEMRKKH